MRISTLFTRQPLIDMPFYNEIDPFHNIPRQNIVPRRPGGSQKGLFIFALALIVFSVIFWLRWLRQPVPNKYLLDLHNTPDRDYTTRR